MAPDADADELEGGDEPLETLLEKDPAELGGLGRASNPVAALQEEDAPPRASEVRRRDESVVTAADDDGIELHDSVPSL